MGTKIQTAIELELRPAWCGHMIALAPSRWETLQQTGETLWCPFGHEASFTDNENTRLRKQLAEAQEFANNARHREQSALAMLTTAQKETKRLARRAKNGICTVCHRTFSQVARHMAMKHPEARP